MLPYSRQEAPGLSPNQARASFEAPGDSFFPSAAEDAGVEAAYRYDDAGDRRRYG